MNDPEFSYTEVCGILEDGIEIIDEHGVNHSFALEFRLWEEWMGMNLSENLQRMKQENIE